MSCRLTGPTWLTAGWILVAVMVASPIAHGQIVFQDGFTNAANWTVLASSSDTRATFNYDYGANDAIPAAPNGSDRIGLKLEANLVGSDECGGAGGHSGIVYTERELSNSG